MILFGKMEVEGFASINKELFDWGNEGLNIIQAPNGNGKTTFINALMWVIYGKSLSGSVEPWPHIRPSSYRGTRVGLTLYVNNIEYKIIRYKDFSKMKNSLILEGGNKNEDEGKRETQLTINNLIGYSFELFKNTIIFGQKLKRIISETGPNKKKVFDEAFEIGYIGRAKKLAEEKLTDYNKEYNQYESEYEILQEKIEGKKSSIEAEESLVNNFKAFKRTDIKQQRTYIKDLQKEIDDIGEGNGFIDIEKSIETKEQKIEEESNKLTDDNKLITLEKELTKLESEENNKTKEAEKLLIKIEDVKEQIKHMATNCPSCGKAYLPNERKKAKNVLKEFLETHKKEYQIIIDSIGIINGQIKDKKSTISSVQKIIDNLDTYKEELESLEDIKLELTQKQDSIRVHKNRIKEIKKRKLIHNLDKLNSELLELKTELKDKGLLLRKTKRDKKTYEWLIKDPLSNSGLKAFIFNLMLDDINEKLEYYSSFIGFQVAFVMDMKSARKDLETYVFKLGEPVPYDDLSGGQQQAVDIVTAFAIHDVVSDSKECSLLIMDEVFESLDRDNIEIMTELIQDKAQSKCLYLVTHRSEFNPTNANIIQIDYIDGMSSIS